MNADTNGLGGVRSYCPFDIDQRLVGQIVRVVEPGDDCENPDCKSAHERRKQQAAEGAAIRWNGLSETERRIATLPGRKAFKAALVQKIDPAGEMSEAELAPRLRTAMSAHFRRIAQARWQKQKAAAE